MPEEVQRYTREGVENIRWNKSVWREYERNTLCEGRANDSEQSSERLTKQVINNVENEGQEKSSKRETRERVSEETEKCNSEDGWVDG